MRTCEVCGIGIEDKRKGARYCGGRCKKRAQRAGLARSAPVDSPKIEPSLVPRLTRKPSTDDIVRLVVAADSLEASFRFASLKAEYRLRPMCARIADAIGSSLDKEGLR